jgi:hypothetical protein
VSDHFPIHDLIESQRERLGLCRNEFARRCGFKNVAKGLRRIDGVCHGDLESQGARMVLDNLATALEVDRGVVENSIAATTEIIAEKQRKAEVERDAAWRESVMTANFDEWTTRRVIRQYNFLRLKAGLCPIAMEEEIDRIRVAKSKAKIEFIDFVHHSPLRQRVSEKLLTRMRRRRNDPNWRPFGMLSGGGMAFEMAVTRQMEKLWSRQQGPAQIWRREQRNVVRTEWINPSYSRHRRALLILFAP